MPTALSVELTADIIKLERQLKAAEAKIRNFEKGTVKSGKGAAAGFNAVGKGAANAVPTLQEFSRVIQDAPFGIQGVGNNITQLVSNFGNLSRAAGGGAAALRILSSAFIGPAGILFAISTVVSLLTVFSGRLKGIGGGAKSAEEAIKSLNEELERSQSVLNADLKLNEETERSLKLQGKQTDGIRLQRIEILKAQVKGVEASIQQAEALLEIKKTQNQVISNWEFLSRITSTITKQVGGFLLLGLKQVKDVVDQSRKPFEDLVGFEEAKSKFAGATKEQKQEEKDLEAAILGFKAKSLGLTNDILELEKGITEEKRKQSGGFTPTTQGINALSSSGVQLSQNAPPIAGQLPTRQAIVSQSNEVLQALLDFNTQASQIINDGIGNTFAGIGEAIGSALANGGNVMSAVGASLLSSLGGILVELGKLAISVGVGLQAVQASLTSLNPGAAIAAGIALVAIGSAFKSGAQQLGGNFGSGSGSFGGQGSGNFSGSTSISRSAGFNGGGEVVFRIQGQALVGVLNRTLKSQNKSIGNSI